MKDIIFLSSAGICKGKVIETPEDVNDLKSDIRYYSNKTEDFHCPCLLEKDRTSVILDVRSTNKLFESGYKFVSLFIDSGFFVKMELDDSFYGFPEWKFDFLE